MRECGVRQKSLTKLLVSWCIRKKALNSLVFAALRTPRRKHRIPIVVFFCCISVEGSVFLVLMPERTPAKTRGFVVCECGAVLQYIKTTVRFTVCLQQTSKFENFAHLEKDRYCSCVVAWVRWPFIYAGSKNRSCPKKAPKQTGLRRCFDAGLRGSRRAVEAKAAASASLLQSEPLMAYFRGLNN